MGEEGREGKGREGGLVKGVTIFFNCTIPLHRM